MPSGGPAMQMPPAMAFPKGNASFMPPQQQRMEVTVPVPEARVSILLLLVCCFMLCIVLRTCLLVVHFWGSVFVGPVGHDRGFELMPVCLLDSARGFIQHCPACLQDLPCPYQ